MNRGRGAEHRLLDRRIEALGVADRQAPLRFARLGASSIGLGGCRRHRLLDEHMYAALEKRLGDRRVDLGRRRDRHRIDRVDLSQQSSPVGVRSHGDLRPALD